MDFIRVLWKEGSKMRTKSGRFINMTVFLSVLTTFFPFSVSSSEGSLLPYEFTSTLNPVGSGARAIGRGGAFIAVADDATAASWNPAGLIQLKRKPEMSVVTSAYYREEDNHFGKHPEASGKSNIIDGNINYLSFAGAFELFDRNMSAALTYQHLYDFNRKWEYTIYGADEHMIYTSMIFYLF